ncbi:MAG: hypothetical protein ACRDNG_14085 [Gaiellaceae bacterium]
MSTSLRTRVRMLRGRIKELWSRVEKRWDRILEERFHGTDRKAVAARWAVAIVLFFVALAILLLLNWLLRGAGLWGDLAFAIVVTTGVFWIARRVAHQFLVEDDIKALPRAFATTIFVLVGVPVAYVTRPWGLVLLLLPVGVWAVTQLVYWNRERRHPPKPDEKKKRFPVFWHAEVAGVALLAIVLFVAPSVGSPDRVPKAVPVADAQGEERDLELAARFRPLLFFDSGERRYPLDIQDAIEDDRMQICRKAVGDDNCDLVKKDELLDANLDYLELEEAPGTPRGGDEGSAIYYHVTRPDDDERVYVDYWWFYSRNPSPVADKVFCGPGLRTPPYTCQEHAGDWEGLTAVLVPCTEGAPDCEVVGDESLAPEDIRYGQHEHVVAYDWDEVLVPYWRSLEVQRPAALQATWSEVVLPAIDKAGPRAIAFVARNSHASYPNPCFGGCKQETRDLPEAVRNGAVSWVHNDMCDECVHALPLTEQGEPALWNAFPGRWGEQHCILAGAYCDLSGAPKGPAFQERYENPGAGDVVQLCLSGAETGVARFDRCP